jgi:hypothetical protein
MASQERLTGGLQSPPSTRLLAGVLGVMVLALGLAAPSQANWKRVLAHRSKTHPYFACSNRRIRCHLIVDPTGGLRSNGPVRAGAITAGPELETSPALKGHGVSGGYAPEDLRSAYKLPSTSAGAGQTVAIVDAFNDPNVEADLNAYRAHYKIAPCTAANGCFRQVNQSGGTTHATPSVGWSEEISLDVDMVSAVCPECHITLVEATSASSTSLAAAVEEAVKSGATEISNSYGSLVGEELKDSEIEAAYYHPGIPITVAAGDEGYAVEEPADYPHVIAVGGTTLLPEAKLARGWKETVWHEVEEGEISGTGSGCSTEPKPSWQKAPSLSDGECSGRTNNDIAVVGDQNTPVSAYDSYCGKKNGEIIECENSWMLEGGTSVGSPIVAAAMALTNGYTRSFDGAHAVYVDALLDEGAFNDITEGSNGTCTPPASHAYFCTARVGYDGPSGLGTLRGAPEAPPPVLETKTAEGVAAHEATAKATITPNDASFAECRFEYVLNTSEYGKAGTPHVATACPPEAPETGVSPVALSAHLTGLAAATKYHYRVTVYYRATPFFKNQSSSGGDSTFTTVGATPSASTEPASALTSSTATLNASVDPNGTEVTKCTFEYGKSTSYGFKEPCSASPGSGQSYVAASAQVSNLEPETTYHFRIVATNTFGTEAGSDRTFTTKSVLPVTAPAAATEISATAATLNATVNPDRVKVTECVFEYGSSTAYGESVPCSQTPGEAAGPVPVSAAIAGLQPGHVYHFRVLARNSHGVSPSSDESFLTPGEPPEAVTQGAFSLGTGSATLTGAVTPAGAAISSCRFEYGTSSAGILEASAPCSSLPVGTEEGAPVSAVITGLAAGTTYHYRLVAANASGTTYGATLSFTTAPPTLQGEGGELIEQIKGHGQPGPGLPTLASHKLSVNAHGSLVVPVKCPAGSSSCAGTISLQVAMAVGARHAAAHHVLVASGRFTIGGGRVSTIHLRLSHTARTLLRRGRVLHASATITPTAGKAARTTVTIRAG